MDVSVSLVAILRTNQEYHRVTHIWWTQVMIIERPENLNECTRRTISDHFTINRPKTFALCVETKKNENAKKETGEEEEKNGA